MKQIYTLFFLFGMSFSGLYSQSPTDDGTIVVSHNYDSDTNPPNAVGGFGFTSSVALSSDADVNGTGFGVEFYYDSYEFTDDTIFLYTFTNVAPGDYIIQYDINAAVSSFSYESLICEDSCRTVDRKQQTVSINTGAGSFQKRYSPQYTLTATGDITFAMYMSPFYSAFTDGLVYIDNVELIKMNAPLSTVSGTIEQTEDYDAASSPPPSTGHANFTSNVELTSAADVNGTGLGVDFHYTASYNEITNSVDLVTFSGVTPGTYYISYQYDDGNASTIFDFSYYNQISDGSNTITNYINVPTTSGFVTHRTYEITINTTSDLSLKWIAGEKNNNVIQGTPIFIDNVELIKTAALPVELSDFRAHQEEGSILLEWATESEINNAGFKVQRSTDGNHFETLDFIEGSNNSTAKIQYVFRDSKIQNGMRYYYRLKQLDIDGRFEYSNIISAEYKGKSAVDIKIFPNPSDTYTNIVLDGEMNEISIQLYSALGELVLMISDIIPHGNNLIQLNTSGLDEGIYFVKIKADDYTISKRLLVNRRY